MAFLDWNNIGKSTTIIDIYFFYPFYNQLRLLSQQSRFISLSAPFVGAIDGIASLVQAVAGVGEAGIKGTGNCLQGAFYRDSESIKRGGLQILLGGGGG